VRVDGRGRPMRIVTRGVLTSGTFTARLPALAGARYALRLEVGERRWWSWITTAGPLLPVEGPASEATCPAAGTGAGELRVEPAAARPGAVVTARLTNTGTGCLGFGALFHWDALLPDGTWEPVESDRPSPSWLRAVGPGGTATMNALVFPELQPGPHRMVTIVDGPDGELTLYAPFEVLPSSAG
jgi:hypothetical protein